MAMPQESVAFRAGLEVVRAVEPRIAEAITDELDSQRHQLKLIASENYASPAVLLAMGNWLSDKYAEGTPGHRFYAGCEVVDRIEIVAGYSAYPRNPNFRLLREIADEVDATLLVDMAHFAGLVAGKVLTGDLDPVPHAHIVTSTTHKSLRGPRGGMVLCTDDYAEFVDRGCPMVLGGPMPHVMAAKAVAFAEARTPAFADYAQRIVANAGALAESLMRRGVRLVTAGTDNHLVLLDVTTSFGPTGRQAEAALPDAGILTHRNSIPADPNGAWYTSGVRLGTPALTTLGLGVPDFDEVADLITLALRATRPVTANGKQSQARYTIPPEITAQCRSRCADLLERFPLYPTIEL